MSVSRSEYLSRRALLGSAAFAAGAVLLGARSGAEGAQSEIARPMHYKAPSLDDPIVVDLSDFDPTGPLPGWNGSAATQRSNGAFPQTRDLLIRGHTRETWSGDGFIRGGRNVVWRGGTYSQNIWLRNFVGDACAEGILVRFPASEPGTETGDGITLVPDVRTAGESDIFILNCRVEGVDGNRRGLHGDIFQMPAMYDGAGGYCATPRRVVIERLTGSTGYQGLFLAAQQFGSTPPACRQLMLRDVNLRKTRGRSMDAVGTSSESGVNLLWMLDMTADKGGNHPYPKVFRNVYLEPIQGEDLNSMIFPRMGTSTGNPSISARMLPFLSSDGKTAWYPRDMMLDGGINYGPPPEGDFAREADAGGRGGLDVPGRGYISPGTLW